jgi:hypothetical protein
MKGKQAALFKKSAQKLLLIWPPGVSTSTAQINKNFLRSFFLKKRPLPLSLLHAP